MDQVQCHTAASLPSSLDAGSKQQKEKVMEIKRSWWSLKIEGYPEYEPNDVDLEHIAECIKQGYDNGELIQEAEDEDQE
jgi:hypothetical protein